MKKPVRPIHGVDRNNHEQVMDRVHQILNGGISHGQVPNPISSVGQAVIPGNVDNNHVTVQTAAVVNTDFTFTHNLGRIPTGFIAVNPSAKVNLWRGTVTWTTTQMTLQADAINIVVVLQIY